MIEDSSPTKSSVSRFERVLKPASGSALETLYGKIKEGGFGGEHPINWFNSMGTRPDLCAAGWALIEATLVTGELPPTVKQMIAATVSARNRCRYCTVAHVTALQQLGVPEPVIESCTSDAELRDVPAAQRPILKFALRASSAPQSLTDDDFEELYDNGLTEGEVMEVIHVAISTNFVNAWADASGIDVDVG